MIDEVGTGAREDAGRRRFRPAEPACDEDEAASAGRIVTASELPDLCAAAVLHSTAATPIILVDGLSGSGKTTLAANFARALETRLDRTVRILGPDLWFPGWEGLTAAQPVTRRLLADLRAGRVGSYLPWDWEAGAPLAPVRVEPGSVTVCEGCGTITPATAPLADLAVWVEAEGEEAERRERAIARDGETYRPWWDVWARQDEARLAVDRPLVLADLVVRT